MPYKTKPKAKPMPKAKAKPKAKAVPKPAISKKSPAQQQKDIEKAIAADRKRLANPVPTAAEQRRMAKQAAQQDMDKKMKAAAKRNYKNKSTNG